jgi:hypothetical protein
MWPVLVFSTLLPAVNVMMALAASDPAVENQITEEWPECAARCMGLGGTPGCYGCPNWLGFDPFAPTGEDGKSMPRDEAAAPPAAKNEVMNGSRKDQNGGSGAGGALTLRPTMKSSSSDSHMSRSRTASLTSVLQSKAAAQSSSSITSPFSITGVLLITFILCRCLTTIPTIL